MMWNQEPQEESVAELEKEKASAMQTFGKKYCEIVCF